MPKTMLLGEAPGRNYDDAPAFSSKSGQRLTALLGQDVRELFWCYNLLDKWPGKSSGKGAAFPAEPAEIMAKRICRTLVRRHLAYGAEYRIILAGKRVAKAMKMRPETPYLSWESLWLTSTMSPCEGITVAILPHPSGVNRWWNDPQNEARAKEFLLDEARLTGMLSA